MSSENDDQSPGGILSLVAMVDRLAETMRKAGLAELDYTGADGFGLRMAMGGAAAPAAPATVAAPPAGAPTPMPEAEAGPALVDVPAPGHGIFYAAEAPDKPPLVAVGDSVAAGQVLALVEAMKMFTELAAPEPGEVDEILVSSGDQVRAGQVLMRLRPAADT